MARLNVAKKQEQIFTHAGGPARQTNAEQQLRRSVLACLLWEDSFYEDGESIAKRICDLVPQVPANVVVEIAIEARKKLRHVPLLLVREMCRHQTHKMFVADALEAVIQRPDELTEFMAIYWKEGRCPVAAQVKKGLAKAFLKFNEYSLAKYNQDGAIKLRDVLFICHADPRVAENLDHYGTCANPVREITRKYKNGEAKLFRQEDSLLDKVANNKLATPDTWEVELSAGADKKETFERLMMQEKLGALAFLRNLRNMQQAGCHEGLIAQYASTVKLDRVLPFRFISAARAVPAWEPLIESMMLRALRGHSQLPGKTVLLVDNSGSMYGPKVSAKSDLQRSDAAAALAILLREICQEVVVVAYSMNGAIVPARHGFALRDAIQGATAHGGTDTGEAVRQCNGLKYDRIIVITDEQTATRVGQPLTDKAYFINVSVEKNGIGYGKWTTITGWSEAIIDYIKAAENVT